MVKKMKKTLMMFIFALMASTVSAYDAKIDGICYNLVPKANLAEVVAGDDKYSGQVVIPSMVEYEGTTYNVSSIAERAFGSCSELTSVVLPKGIKEIKPETFMECTSLESVSLPDDLHLFSASFCLKKVICLKMKHIQFSKRAFWDTSFRCGA